MRQAELKRRMMLEQKDGAISRGLHNCPQERRFAHSVMTDNAEHFAVLLREADISENRRSAIAGTDIPHRQDHCLACHCLPK
jgi:hypothetical protein